MSLTRTDGITTITIEPANDLRTPATEKAALSVETSDSGHVVITALTGFGMASGPKRNHITLDSGYLLAFIEDLQERYAQIDPDVVGIVEQQDEYDRTVGYSYEYTEPEPDVEDDANPFASLPCVAGDYVDVDGDPWTLNGKGVWLCTAPQYRGDEPNDPHHYLPFTRVDA